MAFGNFSPDLFRKAQDVQKGLAQLREELEERVVEASSGGDLVTAYANGNGTVVKIRIQPGAVDPDDVGLLEDLVVAAVQKAQEAANDLQQREMNKITGGLSLPGLM